MLIYGGPTAAAEQFVIQEIRFEGLKKVSRDTALGYLPLQVGGQYSDQLSDQLLHDLFKSGFFNDIALSRDGDALIIKVVERPSISKITISGNKDIESDQLKQALKSIGLEEGEIFNRSALDRIERELERQYYSQGKYAVQIKSSVVAKDNNRVDLEIDIKEGKVAKIRRIKIVGSSAFAEKELLQQFQLRSDKDAGVFSSDDQYSKIKLSADLENLRSFYLDQGYIAFAIESTQVAITPDKKGIYITVNVHEGDRYSVEDVTLSGDLVLPRDELAALVKIKAGDVFSRRAATESAAAIGERLGREGYAFSNVNTIPEINDEKNTVRLTLFVTPGKRVYVRKIVITGNDKTKDEVLRREMRQMEGGWISTDNVKRSRVRLQRLGYLEDVNVETPAVPGVDDQVDLNVSVKERPSGTLMAGMGYSQAEGFLVNASISQDNFLGNGTKVSANINNSSVNTIYSFSYTNPYYTDNGVSRGFKAYYRTTDSSAANVAAYTTDVYGGAISYGVPLNEYDNADVSLGYENTQINTSASTPLVYVSYLDQNTSHYDMYNLTAGWSHDTRNRTIFADSGSLVSLSMDMALPGSGLEFYKIGGRALRFMPLTSDLVLVVKGEVGYGDSYGNTSSLPFFENYYAGGSQSVRGYRSNSLGPSINGIAQGGSVKTIGNVELVFPVPFADQSKSFRLSTFFDVGNVFDGLSRVRGDEMRASAGIAAIWLTPIAPMTFSYAWPLNARAGDDTEHFQFMLGSFFF